VKIMARWGAQIGVWKFAAEPTGLKLDVINWRTLVSRTLKSWDAGRIILIDDHRDDVGLGESQQLPIFANRNVEQPVGEIGRKKSPGSTRSCQPPPHPPHRHADRGGADDLVTLGVYQIDTRGGR
jgi:hypothetical protein